MTSTVYYKPMSVYCSYCGTCVKDTSGTCPNTLCDTHEHGIQFANKDTFQSRCCSYCKYHNDAITLNTKYCPNTHCQRQFHSVLISKYGMAFH